MTEQTVIPRAIAVLRGEANDAAESVTLNYDARFLRRKRLSLDSGEDVLVDLAETTSLDDADALELDDGRRVAVRAEAESLLEVRGPSLPRLAWHIGNRHTPCQVEAERLLIRTDPVLEKMLLQLGAEVIPVTAPFTPEGGAYGHGRTLGHSHD